MAPAIWAKLSSEHDVPTSLDEFKSTTKFWKCENCPYRLSECQNECRARILVN